jgi:hypothetical protein
MKKLKSYSGRYSSINDFVDRNSLNKKADEIFGKGWEPQNDIENIQTLVGSEYKVGTIKIRTERDKRADDYIQVLKLK